MKIRDWTLAEIVFVSVILWVVVATVYAILLASEAL